MSDPYQLIRVRPGKDRRPRHPDLGGGLVPADGEPASVRLTPFTRRQLADRDLIAVDKEGNPITEPDALVAIGALPPPPPEVEVKAAAEEVPAPSSPPKGGATPAGGKAGPAKTGE